MLSTLFQFTPLREGQPTRSLRFLRWRIFQFTPLREGQLFFAVLLHRADYFNSRPSARGDCHLARHKRMRNISIHAPPRGATAYFLPPTAIPYAISIHAPPRGATACRGLFVCTTLLFQFTPLREGRRCGCPQNGAQKKFQFTPLREGRLQSR